MSSPFVFITTHRIKPGALERFTALHEEYLDVVEQHEPRALAHFTFVNAEGTEASLVQIHPDAESAEHHLAVVAPHLVEAAELVENVAIETYGEPGPRVRAALDHNAQAGVTVRVHPRPLGGFARH